MSGKRKRDLYPLSLGRPLDNRPASGRVMLQWIPQPDRPRLHPYFIGDVRQIKFRSHSSQSPACWTYGDGPLFNSRINDVWWDAWNE